MNAFQKFLSELGLCITIGVCFGGGYALMFVLGCIVEWVLGLGN